MFLFRRSTFQPFSHPISQICRFPRRSSPLPQKKWRKKTLFSVFSLFFFLFPFLSSKAFPFPIKESRFVTDGCSSSDVTSAMALRRSKHTRTAYTAYTAYTARHCNAQTDVCDGVLRRFRRTPRSQGNITMTISRLHGKTLVMPMVNDSLRTTPSLQRQPCAVYSTPPHVAVFEGR